MKPLDGVRILDLSRVLAGPYGTLLLADLGADVIKVEPPSGDNSRGMPGHAFDGVSAYYLALNRNKKSIVLNLKSADGQHVFQRLAKHSDVVFDNYRPGVLKSMGIDYETLSEINPRLIACSVTGFGPTGPDADRPAFDLVAQSVSGVLSFTGHPGGPPARPGLSIADISTGIFSALAVVSALQARERTGRGQQVDVSLLNNMISQHLYFVTYYFASGYVPGPIGTGHPTGAPYGAYRAKDRYFILDGHLDQFFANLCTALGKDDWLGDHIYATRQGRHEHREQLNEDLNAIFQEKPAEEWIALLQKHQVPSAPINNIAEALAMEQVKVNRMLVDIETGKGGTFTAAGNPIKMSDTPCDDYEHPPLLGEHTDEVLRTVGAYSDDEIADLRTREIVR